MNLRTELSWLTDAQLIALAKQKTDMDYQLILKAGKKTLINILAAVPDVLTPEVAQ
jgi:hypothetical protein